MDTKIKATSYRLPNKIKRLIDALHQKLLISRTAVVVLAILDFAEKEEVLEDKED